MVDLSMRMLGRKAIRTDSRTLRLARYMTALPPAPASRDWLRGQTNFGMMLNDSLGDCTIAACGHAVQVWTLNAAPTAAGEQTVPNSDILAMYEQWCGYNPRDPSTDQGGIELDVLANWRKNGFGKYKHKMLAFAAVNTGNLAEVHQAINLFGGVYIGLGLPVTAQDQTEWSYVPNDPNNEPGSWGGHAVFAPAYAPKTKTCITWGEPLEMTDEFWSAYVDECYALLSPQFIEANGDTPDGFNMAQLLADLAAIR
jgi:hypothetical protein